MQPPKIPDLLKWDQESMTSGIPLIDEQHRELIAQTNELYRIHQTGATLDDIKATLKYLGEYAKQHFRCEEELMEKLKCPMHQTNCIAHSKFLRDYQELVSNFSIEQDPDEIACEIESMVARWLSSHICKVDTALRKPPEEKDTPGPAQPPKPSLP